MAEPNDSGVLIIYTGGTIGSLPKDRNDPLSALEPAPLEDVLKELRAYDPRDKKLLIGKTRVRIGAESFEPPLDSSNIQPDDWVRMAQIVKDNIDNYEGFVLLHGTDTLAYTASALAFMLDNLQKPVVITGSQRAIAETRSDAVQNLVTAVEIAAARTLGADVVPEVCVFFRDTLTRGCRTTKLSASSFAAFDSPNLNPLGRAGEHIVIDTALLRTPSTQRLQIKKQLDHYVASVDIFPGIQPAMLDKMFTALELHGVVLQTFGTGNAPSNRDFLASIGAAVDRGIIVVDVTQCREGEVELGLYDVSAGLLARGVVSGMDMTPEAALTKLFVVLGEQPDPAIAADLMQLNMRGEQRLSIFNLHFPAGEFTDDKVSIALEPLRAMVSGRERFRPDKVKNAVLRITGLEIPNAKRGIIQFRVFIDDPNATERTNTTGNAHFLGATQKNWNRENGDETVVLSVTPQVREFVDNSHMNTLTLVNTSGQLFNWKRAHIACYADS